MLSHLTSSAIIGVEAYPVEIEVDARPGFPQIIVVGLPDIAVKESRDRVYAAIKNSQLAYPAERLTINLAPADIRKEGPTFDLPIAIGILAASEQICPGPLGDYIFTGELALDGTIRPIKGALPMALCAKESEKRGIILPKENALEAAVVRGIEVLAVTSLAQVVRFLNGVERLKPKATAPQHTFNEPLHPDLDFSDVKGQLTCKRSLEVAAAGGHNVLMIGPPGSGKTMLARRLATIMPDLSLDEAIETTKIHSVAGLMPHKKPLLSSRPFRAPHHTASDISLIGGGTMPKPGEVSLAHNGILFLDELPEFDRNVLEVLRQPLEDGFVTVSRIKHTVRYPARFTLVAAMNPCPCGYYGDRKKECRCTPNQIRKYIAKISGPLLDRIDIHIEVQSLQYKELSGESTGEASGSIKARVEGARKIQQGRLNETRIYCNSQMSNRHIKRFCQTTDSAKELLRLAMTELGLSARAYDKVLKVGRTIADLAGSADIQAEHISEAIQYRALDRNWWG